MIQLPTNLFLNVSSLLEPKQLIASKRVSKSWKAKLQPIWTRLMKKHYPGLIDDFCSDHEKAFGDFEQEDLEIEGPAFEKMMFLLQIKEDDKIVEVLKWNSDNTPIVINPQWLFKKIEAMLYIRHEKKYRKIHFNRCFTVE